MDLYMIFMFILGIMAAIAAMMNFSDNQPIAGLIMTVVCIFDFYSVGLHYERMQESKGYTYEVIVNNKNYYTNDLGIIGADVSFTTSTGERITA